MKMILRLLGIFSFVLVFRSNIMDALYGRKMTSKNIAKSRLSFLPPLPHHTNASIHVFLNFSRIAAKIRSLRGGIPFLKVCIIVALCNGPIMAQVDLKISGPEAGFPVAVYEPCYKNIDNNDKLAKISRKIRKNLDFSLLFRQVPKEAFIQKISCYNPRDISYSDWSIIGAEGLVVPVIKNSTQGFFEAEIYLFDIIKKKAVAGKRYRFSDIDVDSVADQFSNVVFKYFTRRDGIFGSKISFVSKVGRFKELFLMDFDGENLQQITSDKGLVVSPSFNQSGQKIVFTSYKSRKPELYIYDIKRKQMQKLTDSQGMELGARFAYDSPTIISSSTEGGQSDIVRFSLSGKIVEQITSSAAIDVSPTLSSNGRNFAFVSSRSGNPQIYVSDLRSRSPKRLSFTGSNYCTSPAWSPVSNDVVFVCRSNGYQIYLADVKTGESVQLTYSGINEDPEWSPDGNYLVYSSNTGKSGVKSIMLMEMSTLNRRTLYSGRSDSIQPTWSVIQK